MDVMDECNIAIYESKMSNGISVHYDWLDTICILRDKQDFIVGIANEIKNALHTCSCDTAGCTWNTNLWLSAAWGDNYV